jgi:putative two-component system response regulator
MYDQDQKVHSVRDLFPNPETDATILVADDHAPNRDLLEEVLTSAGFTVLMAEDGAAALQKFKRLRPDLVLLDVMMPHLTGFEVCARIKADKETCLTPVILVTALSAKEDRVAGITAGADDFLTRPVDTSELLARVCSLLRLKRHTDELERAENVLFALARSIESKDPYTEHHCDRLSTYAATLGEALGLPIQEITALRRAGVVHDIGKVAVPDAILLKPGKLSDDEWKIMRQHPVVGERICTPLKSFRLVLPIIRHHHEKLDGSGYPDGLRGAQIPITARVLQIVDVFDALTTARPYKRALSLDEALETMSEEIARGWWDQNIFEEFKKILAEPHHSLQHNGRIAPIHYQA